MPMRIEACSPTVPMQFCSSLMIGYLKFFPLLFKLPQHFPPSPLDLPLRHLCRGQRLPRAGLRVRVVCWPSRALLRVVHLPPFCSSVLEPHLEFIRSLIYYVVLMSIANFDIMKSWSSLRFWGCPLLKPRLSFLFGGCILPRSLPYCKYRPFRLR